MDTFITNVTAVTMTPGTEVLFGVNIGITDGKIEFISKKVPEEMPKTIIEGTGMVAMPGLINCHTHLATSVLRCFTDDLTNKEALEALLQKEAKMDSRSAKAAALLSIAECLALWRDLRVRSLLLPQRHRPGRGRKRHQGQSGPVQLSLHRPERGIRL